MDKINIIRMVEQKIERAISDFGMENKLNGVLIGYSGGADSSALLFYMQKYAREHGIYIAAVHVNHCIRGDEADRDEEFCRRTCKSLGMPLFVERVDVPALAKETGRGIEDAARFARYRIFRSIVESNENLRHIALAHHADDNMETIIFNMLRGTGTRGLTGIPPVRGERVIRPLIYCTKSEIIGYCIANDIAYINDTTNTDVDYTRNYIRYEIVPRLTRINPSPEVVLSRLSTILRNDDVYIQRQALRFMQEHEITSSCSRSLIAEQDPAIQTRLIRYMYDNYASLIQKEKRDYSPLDFNHVYSVLRMITGSSTHAQVSLPQRICAAVHGDSFFFMDEEEHFEKYNRQPEFHCNLTFGVTKIPEINATISLLPSPDAECEKRGRNVYKIFIHEEIAIDKIKGNIFVRSRQAGDTITVNGMTKLTKKLYCEKKIPLDERSLLPVFCDDDGIILIPTVAIRDGVSALDGEKAIHIYYAFGGEESD
ncbi:MAG: tRNA lysidine(34) synthetase TilS [Eubacteriales bacterium]|jgi:tRNA(Ile)-lysidine synthase|nr:tRNA lysidine(34) synthetase TilS [Clostridiales bacterium]